MPNDPRGSNWRKWDLHVHTPDSIVHRYSGKKDQAWEGFLTDLERLPPEFKVLGINDYIFIDGYRRAKDAKAAGRLKNIDLLLPVIELRIDKFGGTNSHFQRVNFHVIFSDEISPDLIQTQFLNGLSTSYRLDPTVGQNKPDWNALVTRDSLKDLGERIIASVPLKEQEKFNSSEMEGFNNINFDLDNLERLLSSHYFKDKCLTAVGKAEWANIKWTDHSIADKKDIINRANFVFISSESPEAYNQARKQLRDSNVNDRLLDCSDAHSFSNSNDKDRIGKCFTWIKADPTFEGLRHIVKGFEERVFIGETPNKMISVRENPTKYIQSLKINKKPEVKFDEIWFDSDAPIEFNHGLVAIIGNKGNAKSALTDIIGLLGNTGNHSHFSFLNGKKFRQSNNNKAKYFEASMCWESGQLVPPKSLDDKIYNTDVGLVKYIPQHFFEDICNEVSNKGDSEFDRELEQVIFSHVKEADKLGKRSLKVLIEHKTSEVKEAITQLITEIQQMNKKIVTVQDFLAPHYRKLIENKLEGKKQELAAHRDSVPAEVPNPETQKDQENRNSVLKELDNAKKHIREIGEEIAETEKKIEALAIEKAQVEKGENKIINLKAAIERIRTEFGQLRLDGISFDDVIKIQYNDHLLEKKKTHIRAEKVNLQSRLDESQSTGLPSQKKAAQEKVALLQEKLDEPNKAYQQYLKEVDRWKNQERKILNGEPDSIQSYQNILQKIGEKPEELRKLNKLRLDTTKKIFEQLQRLVATYKELYAPVQDFINRNPLATKFSLNFDVSIKDMGFGEQFFEWINQSVSGTFCGKDPGRKMLEELLLACNFNDWAQVETFLESITHRLDHDVRLDPPSAVQVKDQMRKSKSVESLYDFIFSLEYLVPRYVLKMGDKEMYQLSPGEKGTLLLVFYLLVDHDDIPLIIDQPEENLDNQTVYELLVPSISQARQRRQIIIVTHNPNLAVVCDAEQIIYATMDKKNGNKVTYTTGAIENPEINKHLLDVLEGTRPAFDKRNSKYIP